VKIYKGGVKEGIRAETWVSDQSAFTLLYADEDSKNEVRGQKN